MFSNTTNRGIDNLSWMRLSLQCFFTEMSIYHLAFTSKHVFESTIHLVLLNANWKIPYALWCFSELSEKHLCLWSVQCFRTQFVTYNLSWILRTVLSQKSLWHFHFTSKHIFVNDIHLVLLDANRMHVVVSQSWVKIFFLSSVHMISNTTKRLTLSQLSEAFPSVLSENNNV